MRNLLGLWLLCLGVTLVVVLPIEFAMTRTVDLRYGPFLTVIVAPLVEAVVLLVGFPTLRDRASLADALRRPAVARAASAMLVAVVAVAALWTMRLLPATVFSIARAALLAIGAALFLAAARQTRAAAGVAALMLGVAAITGRSQRLALHFFPAQPLLFRWIVFYGACAIVIVAALFWCASHLRRSSSDAAVLLEWSLAPALVASLIVIANVFWHPFLTSGWWMAANVLGVVAAAGVVVAGVAAMTPRTLFFARVRSRPRLRR